MQDPIAETRLTYRAGGKGADQPVFVRVGRPAIADAAAPLWAVEYEIDGPGDAHYVDRAYGADAMQALGLVFYPIRQYIEAFWRDGVLMWEDANVGLRFPM